MGQRFRITKHAIWIGLGLVLAYWVSVRPPDISVPGYTEDMCQDIARQMIAEQIQDSGRPTFFSDGFMAPYGTPVPFMSWAMERDALGALFWILDRGLPFYYFYFGLSLIFSYLGSGFLMRKMGVSPLLAWGLAALVTVFHLPKHFKAYHHYEHLIQHWVYWSFFLDAWIVSRMVREKKWSWVLELWRGFLMLGTFGLVGYYWGAMLLEWGLVRLALAAYGLALWRQAPARAILIEGSFKAARLPIALCALWLIFELAWFIPLYQRVQAMGGTDDLWQPLWFFSELKYVFQPLWLDRVLSPALVFKPWIKELRNLDRPETVLAVGWIYWVPALLGAGVVLWKRRTQGLWLLLPFATLLVFSLIYIVDSSATFQPVLHAFIPFLRFFRVCARWGLFLPLILSVIIVLCSRDLSEWAKGLWNHPSARLAHWFHLGVGLFIFLSFLELTWIAYPVNAMPKLHPSTAGLLEKVKQLPGDTVLDLPFCVTGGTGVCGDEFCPHYPASTIGLCLRAFHGKKVFGTYQARMADQTCEIYRREPYLSWASAWKERRCLNDAEFKSFCAYLDETPGLSAVLLHPDIWGSLRDPACMENFEKRLGAPLARSLYASQPNRNHEPRAMRRILMFRARCQAQPN